MRFLLRLLESCDNRAKGRLADDEQFPAEPLVPTDRPCQRTLPAAHRQTLMPGLGSVGCRGLDNVYSKKRGEVTMTCAPDLESNLTESPISLGKQALRLCYNNHL